jgi:hypothetical protein
MDVDQQHTFTKSFKNLGLGQSHEREEEVIRVEWRFSHAKTARLYNLKTTFLILNAGKRRLEDVFGRGPEIRFSTKIPIIEKCILR